MKARKESLFERGNERRKGGKKEGRACLKEEKRERKVEKKGKNKWKLGEIKKC